MTYRPDFYYKRLTISATAFPDEQQVHFPFSANHVIISSDSDQLYVKFSFLPPNLDGELFKKEQPIVFDGVHINRIWFSREANNKPNPEVRVWAWKKGK